MRLAFLALALAACSAPSTMDSGTAGGSATGGGSAAGGGSAGGSQGGGSGGGTASSDAGFYGAPRCPPNTLACDDFEGASIDTAVWNIHLDSGGTLTQDTTRAARGTKSLHAVSPMSGGDAMVELKMKVPLSGQRLWGRMFLYFPAAVEPELMDHTNLGVAFGDNAQSNLALYAAWVGGKKIGSLYYVDTGVDEFGLGITPPSLAPLDRWFCLEWDFNGVDKEIRVFMDGALIPMSVLAGPNPPVTATLRAGIQAQCSEAWFDSVAWSRTRIGCEN